MASATVSISGGTFAGDGDVLGFDTTGTSIVGLYDSSTETLTLSGSDTLAHYQQVLDSVTFASGADPSDGNADPTRTVTWVVNDGTASSTAVTTTVDIHLGPAISVPATAAFTEGGAPTKLAPAVTLSDTNPGPLGPTWASEAAPSSGAISAAADLVGGKVYVFDGVRADSVSSALSSAISIYDIATNSWQDDTAVDTLARQDMASEVLLIRRDASTSSMARSDPPPSGI